MNFSRIILIGKNKMENEIIPVLNVQTIFNKERVDLIKKTICQGATDDELKLFLTYCERTGLDPFARQIYSLERKSKNKDGTIEKKRTTQISIDGLRLIAQRSGEYAGQTQTEWCGEDGVWKNVWTSKDAPFAARVGVLRNGFKEPLYAIAKWNSYAFDGYGNVQTMWKKMPDHMLAKVAESLALRKAFPQELSGLYTSEEMADVIDVKSEEIYEAKKEQKLALMDVVAQFDIEKTPENYKWFNDKILGCKMTDLYEHVAKNLHEFKQLKQGVIECQG